MAFCLGPSSQWDPIGSWHLTRSESQESSQPEGPAKWHRISLGWMPLETQDPPSTTHVAQLWVLFWAPSDQAILLWQPVLPNPTPGVKTASSSTAYLL